MTTAILDTRLAARPVLAPAGGGTADLERLCELKRLPARGQRLVCHWHRQADGRLSCVWEADTALVPTR